MSFKKFRHSLGRLLRIKKYLFMAESGKTLDLDALLGPPRDVRRRADWRTEAVRLFAERDRRPRAAVHCGDCSEKDLAWYASAGFGKVLLLAPPSDPPLAVPAGLELLRMEGKAHATWAATLSKHSREPAEFEFFSFSEGGQIPTSLPTSAQAVRWRLRLEGDACLASAAQAKTGYLADQGLNLAFLGPRQADGQVDALFLRRPVVTMSDFGRNGRFGNQLFQRTFLRLVARRQGAILQLPLWAGTALFGVEDPPPSARALPLVREESLDPEARRLLWAQTDARFVGLDFSGYGMSPTGMLAGHREEIRAEHAFDLRLTARFDAIMGPLLASGKKLIVIHLRRGDYGYGQFFRAPCAWYQEWMARQGFTPATHVLYICSEDPGRYRARFAGFTVVTADDIGTPPQLSPYLDFLAMTRADMLAIANSSFSFFAAMLNSKASDFVRPDAEQGGLVAFDPWGAEPLLDQKLSPEEHLRLKEID